MWVNVGGKREFFVSLYYVFITRERFHLYFASRSPVAVVVAQESRALSLNSLIDCRVYRVITIIVVSSSSVRYSNYLKTFKIAVRFSTIRIQRYICLRIYIYIYIYIYGQDALAEIGRRLSDETDRTRPRGGRERVSTTATTRRRFHQIPRASAATIATAAVTATIFHGRPSLKGKLGTAEFRARSAIHMRKRATGSPVDNKYIYIYMRPRGIAAVGCRTPPFD